MVGTSTEGVTQQATGQASKAGKKAQQQAQTPPRATKNDVFDQQTQGGTEEGEEDDEEEYEVTDAGATDAGADDANDATAQVQSGAKDAKGKAQGAANDAQNQAPDAGQEAEEEAVPIGSVNKDGSIAREDGSIVGSVTQGDPKKLEGSIVDQEGDVLDNEGNVIGAADPNAQGASGEAGDATGAADQAAGDAKAEGEEGQGGATEALGQAAGDLKDAAGQAKDTAEQAKDIAGLDVGEKVGVPLDQLPLLDIEGALSFDKDGNVEDESGKVLGNLTEGDPKKLGKKGIKTITETGQLIGEDGTILGLVDVRDISEKLGEVTSELPGLGLKGPFDIGRGNKVTDSAGNVLGKLTAGDPKELSEQDIKDVTEKGELLDDEGKVIGVVRLENLDELKKIGEKNIIPSPEVLEGKTVNKLGKVVDEKGGIWGEVIEGDPKQLAGRRVDKEGQIWNDSGKVIGKAQAYPEDKRDLSEEAPFTPFPGAKVQKNGDVLFEGNLVGKVVEGDPKKMEGHEVDPDGDISDKHGNTLGRAERYDEPEPEPEPEINRSILAGKRVNKAGNLVDEHGSLFGKVIEGDVQKLVGKMSDKDGAIWNESGEIVGRAELIPESEREVKKEGPFANYEGCKVNKEGHVIAVDGEIIGRLIEGDAKQLAGHVVDADGDVIDNQGNSLGKAERWEPEVKEAKHHPCAGLKVNGEGNVINDDGDIIGKLTEGQIDQCRGIEIDDDGDISNQKGQLLGHVTRIEDCKPEKTQEEIEAEERAAEEARKAEEEEAEREKDRKLAKKLSYIIDEYMEKLNPILKEITDKIEAAEATPKEELDEEQLVKEVKPLIEEGGRMLSDCNSEIRGSDPDGRIQTQAKQKAAEGEASPEEYRLAEQLKHMAAEVQHTIDNAKKKLAGMPHAKEQLNPLWGLLSEPLFQILAAVGLLLSGVLGLVGRLLGGLGLGSLVEKLLGGLGVDKILKQFGVLGGKKK